MTPKEHEVLTEALAALQSPVTPDPRMVTQMAGIIDRLVQLIEHQQDALDTLNVLWRAHLVSEATDRVLAAAAGFQAAENDDEPEWCDIWEIDQSKTDLNLTYRTEPVIQ